MDENRTCSCYNCQNQDFTLEHKGCRDKKNIDVLRCKKCGLLRTAPLFSPFFMKMVE